MGDKITYNSIKSGIVPIFNGIYYNGLIYEYMIENTVDSLTNTKIATLQNILECTCERHVPSVLSENYRKEYKEHSLLLECGEGSYGGIGYLCLSTIDEEIICLACFEESNPFIVAEYRDGYIRAMNNIFEMWTFQFDCDGLPKLTIQEIDRGQTDTLFGNVTK